MRLSFALLLCAAACTSGPTAADLTNAAPYVGKWAMFAGTSVEDSIEVVADTISFRTESHLCLDDPCGLPYNRTSALRKSTPKGDTLWVRKYEQSYSPAGSLRVKCYPPLVISTPPAWCAGRRAGDDLEIDWRGGTLKYRRVE